MISEVCALCYWRLKSRAEVYSLWLTPHPLVRWRAECWSCWINAVRETQQNQHFLLNINRETMKCHHDVAVFSRQHDDTREQSSLSAERCIHWSIDWVIDWFEPNTSHCCSFTLKAFNWGNTNWHLFWNAMCSLHPKVSTEQIDSIYLCFLTAETAFVLVGSEIRGNDNIHRPGKPVTVHLRCAGSVFSHLLTALSPSVHTWHHSRLDSCPDRSDLTSRLWVQIRTRLGQTHIFRVLGEF